MTQPRLPLATDHPQEGSLSGVKALHCCL